ncbi:hypothetical protein P4234_16210 [Pseudomonas aeruginosa]|nr:hypothetical protein [Pseudomonas aeruginosa]
MIYVTHDQVEAMTLADKVVVLNGGRVEQVGSPLELYHHPANLFVAGFPGTPKMGFLRGHLSRNQGERREVAPRMRRARRLAAMRAGELATGSPVTLGIRPEHLNIARPGHAFQGLLRVAADVSERLGSDSFAGSVRADSGKCSPCACAAISQPSYGAPRAGLRSGAPPPVRQQRPGPRQTTATGALKPPAWNPPMKLNRQHPPLLATAVARPSYDPAQPRQGIVHIGVGGFHRAHQAAYTDALMNRGEALDWAICGAGLRSDDRAMHDAPAAQTTSTPSTSWRPTGHRGPRDRRHQRHAARRGRRRGAAGKLAEPAIRIVSLTITEGGYCIDDGSGEFLAELPLVRHDLANRGPRAGSSAFSARLCGGAATQACRRSP